MMISDVGARSGTSGGVPERKLRARSHARLWPRPGAEWEIDAAGGSGGSEGTCTCVLMYVAFGTRLSGLGRLRPGISAAGSCSMPGQKNGGRSPTDQSTPKPSM